jgi:hypothetical protein
MVHYRGVVRKHAAARRCDGLEGLFCVYTKVLDGAHYHKTFPEVMTLLQML